MSDPRHIIQHQHIANQRATRQAAEQFEEAQLLYPGTITSQGGSARPSWDPNLLWVRLFNVEWDLTAVWNGGVISGDDEDIVGTSVLMRRTPRAPYPFQIIGVNPVQIVMGGQSGTVSNASIAHHGENHQMPTEDNLGADPVRIWAPAIMLLKTEGNGTSLIVTVGALVYLHNGASRVFPGQSVDLSSYVPAGGETRYVLLYLNRQTNVVNVSVGDTVASGGATSPPYPTIPGNSTPSAFVQLTGGQTAVTTATHVVEARPFFPLSTASGIPDPTAENQILIADETLTWQVGTIDELVSTTQFGWIVDYDALIPTGKDAFIPGPVTVQDGALLTVDGELYIV